jgi:hypothetical protein
MSNKRKWLISGIVAIALGGTGFAVARADGDDDDQRNERVVQMNDVPAAVQQTIQQQFQGATVQRIEKREERGASEYEVLAVRDGKATETVIDENGRVLRLGAADDDKDADECPPTCYSP